MPEISTEFSLIKVATAEAGPYHMVRLFNSYTANFAREGTARVKTFGDIAAWIKGGRRTFSADLDGLLELQNTASHTVTVATGGAALNATTVPVNALSAAIATGTVLYFAGSKLARLSAASASGATSLAVTALPQALAAGEAATVTTAGSQNPLRAAWDNDSDVWVQILPEGDALGARGWRVKCKVLDYDVTGERDGEFIAVSFSLEGDTATQITLA